MNLRALETMVALADHRSLTEAAGTLGLSHSAVSLQLKVLEDELGVTLADRSRRPLTLTAHGLALVERARQVLAGVEQIRAIGQESRLVGSLRVGVVPSALTGLMPPALAALAEAHPELRLQVRSDLSADLAQQVRGGDLDAAVLTGTDDALDGLVAHEIGREPLCLLAPAGTEGDVRALIARHPFIWFSRRTWAGQQIERALIRQNLTVDAVMEVDSLEAIAAMVAAGIGVAIAPRRLGSADFAPTIRAQPFGKPQAHRTLVLLERVTNPRRALAAALLAELRARVRAG